MVLKRQFSLFTEVPPEYFTDIQYQIFDDNDDLVGHYPRISDADLSNDPGQIKDRFTRSETKLLVEASSGRQVTYKGGRVANAQGSILTIAPGILTLPDNATSFVFVNEAGVVSNSLVKPNRWVPMAQVTVSGGAILPPIIDLRAPDNIFPRAEIVQIFGSQGQEGPLNVVAGTPQTITGEHWYSSVNVAAGAVLNIQEAALLHVSGDFTSAGTINIISPNTGGAGYGAGLRSQVYVGGKGSGLGGGHSHNALAPSAYSYYASPLGSGGAGGTIWSYGPDMGQGHSNNGQSGAGGNGGGALQVRCAGLIIISGLISANGGPGENPSGMSSFASSTLVIGGSGGGSGGLIELRSLRSILITPAATLQVKGGRGGDAHLWNPSLVFTMPFSVSGGGGGAGGYIVLVSPSNNYSGAAMQLDGGGPGTLAGSGFGFGSSSGGSFGGIGGYGASPGAIGKLISSTIYPA